MNTEGMTLETYDLLKQHSPDLLDKLENSGEKGVWLRAFVTQDPKMLKMKRDASKLALVNDPVLISGPTGTGKELVAHILHGDRKGAFIPINCAGLPESLVESELFGYERGAFTGATSTQEGLLRMASGGSIFLDEVGELPMSIQPKLLRAIQENKIRKVGGKSEEIVSCRFIFATHRNLKEMCKLYTPKFRDDLYYRISTFELFVSPLEERVRDIEEIVRTLDTEGKIGNIEEFCDRINPKELDGNVRSLQKIVRRFYVLGEMP